MLTITARGAWMALLVGTAGCNAIFGTDPGEPISPILLVSPAASQSVSGPRVTLSWSGGLPPYEVDLALDDQFELLVPRSPPALVSTTRLTLEGLKAGHYYWRVRCTGCARWEESEVRALHVACAPRILAEDVTAASAAVAWDAEDGEYGVAFTRGQPPRLYFVRADQAGEAITEPREIVDTRGAAALAAGVGVEPPAIVASRDRWAIAVRAAGADEVTLLAVNDDAVAEARNEVEADREETRGYDIHYHERIEHLLVTVRTDESTFVSLFDGYLTPALTGSAIRVEGARGALLALPSLATSSLKSVVASIVSTEDDRSALALQLMDHSNGALKAPIRSEHGVTPQELPTAEGALSALPMAWAPELFRIGLVEEYGGDLRFLAIEPRTGDILPCPSRFLDIQDGILSECPPLNVDRVSKAQAGSARISWDGEEFLVAWLDEADGSRLRYARLDNQGAGGADDTLAEPGGEDDVHGQPSLVGHDGLHAIAYSAGPPGGAADLFLCVDPPIVE